MKTKRYEDVHDRRKRLERVAIVRKHHPEPMKTKRRAGEGKPTCCCAGLDYHPDKPCPVHPKMVNVTVQWAARVMAAKPAQTMEERAVEFVSSCEMTRGIHGMLVAFAAAEVARVRREQASLIRDLRQRNGRMSYDHADKTIRAIDRATKPTAGRAKR